MNEYADILAVWIVVTAGIVLLIRRRNMQAAGSAGLICPQCGSRGTRKVNDANGWVFFGLLAASVWLITSVNIVWGGVFFAITGVYFIAGIFRWKTVCLGCGSSALVSVNTPIGRELKVKYYGAEKYETAPDADDADDAGPAAASSGDGGRPAAN